MFVNLTGHNINIAGKCIKPSGGLARCSEGITRIPDIEGVPLGVKTFSPTVGLPEPEEDIIYIVSTIVRIANPERRDIVSPDLPIYDNGCKTGCQVLIGNWPVVTAGEVNKILSEVKNG